MRVPLCFGTLLPGSPGSLFVPHLPQDLSEVGHAQDHERAARSAACKSEQAPDSGRQLPSWLRNAAGVRPGPGVRSPRSPQRPACQHLELWGRYAGGRSGRGGPRAPGSSTSASRAHGAPAAAGAAPSRLTSTVLCLTRQQVLVQPTVPPSDTCLPAVVLHLTRQQVQSKCARVTLVRSGALAVTRASKQGECRGGPTTGAGAGGGGRASARA